MCHPTRAALTTMTCLVALAGVAHAQALGPASPSPSTMPVAPAPPPPGQTPSQVPDARPWRPFSLWLEAGYAGASVRESTASANGFSSRGHGFQLGAGVRVFEVLSARYNGGMLWHDEDHPSSVSTTAGSRQSSLNSIYNTFALGLQTPELALGAEKQYGGWIGLFGGLTTYLTTSRDYGECIDCSTYFSMKGGFYAEPNVVFFVKVGDDRDKSFVTRRLRLSCSYAVFTPGSDFGNLLSVALGFEMW